MKIELLFIFSLGLVIGCNQTAETKLNDSDTTTTQPINKSEKIDTVQQEDTLSIVDSDLTFHPFNFGENPLKKLTLISNVITDFQTQHNRHVKNQIDTVFQIKIGGDYFEIYKAALESWLTKAEVVTDQFQTRHGIKIGMTKFEVKERLNPNLTKNIPDLVRLKSLEVPQWIDLKFKNDTLKLIEFKGYVD